MPYILQILFATIGLLIFSPCLLLFSFLIFWEDGFPIFFRQERLGKNKKSFYILKFRTMRDGQVTRIGSWLRRTGLDEVAQFFNVLKGDMNIVGPRPLTTQDIERLRWNTPTYATRWSVKPGITGLAQVFAGKSAQDSWENDQHYLSTTSTWKDLKLILISFAMNFFGKQAIRRQLCKKNKALRN